MEKKLPEGWKEYKIKDIGDVVTGSTPPKKDPENYGGVLPWIKPPDLDIDKFVSTSEETISETGRKKVRLLPKGSVLVSCIGNIGKVAIADTELCTNQQINSIIPDENIVVSDFLYYTIKKIRPYLENIASSAVVPLLNKTDFSNINIKLPPLEIQQKIVSILEKAEETKKLRAQADELTQELLQSVFLEMFGDPVVNPKNWKEIKLKDVSEIVSGVTKGRKLTGKNTVFVPYLRVANVQDGYLDLTEIKDIEVLPSDVEKYALQDGDILLTEGGDPDKLGRGTVWNKQIPTCIHQNHIFRVRVNKEFLVPEYLSMLIGSAYGKMYFLKSAKQTTGIASINSTQLKNFPALIAPLDLQLKFAEIVHQVEKTTESQKQSSLEINTLFDALMQKAFTGELVS